MRHLENWVEDFGSTLTSSHRLMILKNSQPQISLLNNREEKNYFLIDRNSHPYFLAHCSSKDLNIEKSFNPYRIATNRFRLNIETLEGETKQNKTNKKLGKKSI